jgi:hypothetical protein
VPVALREIEDHTVPSSAASGAYCPYRHFSAVLDRTGVDWWLVMFELEIYFDDSGTHSQSPIAIAACWVAPKRQWDEFNRNWTEVGNKEGFTTFHMADFVAKREYGKKPFCNWDKEKKVRVYEKLVSIINTRVWHGCAIGIPREAYEKYAFPEFKQRYATRLYTMAVKSCMGRIAHWRARYGITEPMQFFFDQMSEGVGEIQDIWKLLPKYPDVAHQNGMIPNGYSFQDKTFFKPLQAADILAWQMYNDMTNVVLKGRDPLMFMHPGFRCLRRDRGHYLDLGYFSDAQVKESFEKLAEYERITGKPGYGFIEKKPPRKRR